MLSNIFKYYWYVSKKYEYPDYFRLCREISHENKYPEIAWKSLLFSRLKNIILFSGKNIDYYGNIFKNIDFIPETGNILQYILNIPLLTKDIIRNNQDLLRSKKNINIYSNATGGSTGVPLVFYQDQQYMMVASALDAHVRSWWGILPYDRTALVWGADREFKNLNIREKLYNLRSRTIDLNAFRMTEEDLFSFCKKLRASKPPYLMGYSSALESFAKYAVKNGFDDLRFKAIRSTAEILFPIQRKMIEEVFKSPVYNFYGSREVNNIAAECPEERRLHLISTWRYVEICDDNGNPLPNGSIGHIVVTDHSNYYMPFIRYQNEDIGSLSRERCSCGRPSPVLENLLGRSTDILRSASGDMVHGEYFTHLFYGRNDITRFQVRQVALNHIILKYVSRSELPSDYICEIEKKIQSQFDKNTHVDIIRCDNIDVPRSGKHRFTISDLSKS